VRPSELTALTWDELDNDAARGELDLLAGCPPCEGFSSSRLALPAKQQLDCHIACDGFKDVYGRMAWDEIAPTITGGCVNPSKGRFLHPSKNRPITLREAALLQTFPPDYKFSLRKGRSPPRS
jgi:site-specific DNA-cytosine methylase